MIIFVTYNMYFILLITLHYIFLIKKKLKKKRIILSWLNQKIKKNHGGGK